MYKVIFVSKRKESFLILVPLLTALGNVCQFIPTMIVLPEIFKENDSQKYNLANTLEYYYPVPILLSSFFSVMSHWVFAI